MESLSNMHIKIRYLIVLIVGCLSISSVSQNETEKEIIFISTKIDSIDIRRNELLGQLEQLKLHKIQNDLNCCW